MGVELQPVGGGVGVWPGGRQRVVSGTGAASVSHYPPAAPPSAAPLPLRSHSAPTPV